MAAASPTDNHRTLLLAVRKKQDKRNWAIEGKFTVVGGTKQPDLFCYKAVMAGVVFRCVFSILFSRMGNKVVTPPLTSVSFFFLLTEILFCFFFLPLRSLRAKSL